MLLQELEKVSPLAIPIRTAPTASEINRELARAAYIGYTPIGYSPFRQGDRAETRASIREDLTVLRKTWNGVITYGCNGTLLEILPVAEELGFERVLLGVYDVSNRDEISNAIALARQYPQLIRAICLGNEGLLFQRYTLAQLSAAFDELRGELPDVLLTTSEPIFAWGERTLLDQVDFASPIIHPWIHELFAHDPKAAAIWVIQAAQRLQILSAKPVFLKETGFPANGAQFPFPPQAEFWKTLWTEYGALTRNVHLATFEAFDNPQKMLYSAPLEWDNHWGIFDANRQPKPCFAAIHEALLPPRAKVSDQACVSVVITAKDRPGFLASAIESVLAQRDAVRRLVLVDDNSSTNAVESIFRRYASNPLVKIVKRSAPGSSGTARNAGLRFVDTDLVCFLDDDDVFLPGKLETQRRILLADPGLAGVAAAAEVIDPEGHVVGRSGCPEFFPGAPLASMVAFCHFVHSSVMQRTAHVRKTGGYREFFPGEDWELWCRLLSEGHRFQFVNSPLVQYRRHAENISNDLYVQKATKNILGLYLWQSVESLLGNLPYESASGNLLKGAIYLVHAKYEDALREIGTCALPAAKMARLMCFRELGRYDEAMAEARGLDLDATLLSRAVNRLQVHRDRFVGRAKAGRVGSAALLMEQRLIARDALAASTGLGPNCNVALYFQANPTNLNIEDGADEITEEIFYSRVTLTSC